MDEKEVTFSDSTKTTSPDEVFVPEQPPTALSFEDYCKRFPDSLECREHDL